MGVNLVFMGLPKKRCFDDAPCGHLLCEFASTNG
jgi:hypothetical protein